ncbi:hypothetical protein Kpol_513p24 [Vanderwaltozyma polyspora DSM 70294]|uniref:Mitochondrial escape protein 2 n=1 Tax=Vanderwaltozyma polyspora (strain ATCC 22028 / DSM 70294 / BCRC 21397 / CBS 2163 / NBRC 10782 / NRRL Y-8283 / UCD 57-17) TaxID=436907 RepID=YME2_VANPO|nr:uncharacterized protein Kpol_513p24 [Vanderwaltozyma polyspora DSM 70294]A7TML0.1 RecName: Full=Mitochondrial escape protein 2; Flags: Precursor [Vanderwaltozyma polyspora DSM 70294]EDO16508.1 hypothetical protein Kpol_513p24 [Vanderwaltozyma polyspora DSM 70294]
MYRSGLLTSGGGSAALTALRAIGSRSSLSNGKFIWNVGKRFITSEIQEKDQQAGESNTATDTGIIHKTEQETLVYFDNVYPRDTSLWNPAQWYNLLLVNQSREAVRDKITEFASPPSNPIHGLELRSTIPVKRDGGVFATFLVPSKYTKAEVNAIIQKNTAEESSKSIFSFFTRASAFPVKGFPWIEDLRRLPTNTIKVLFQGPPLTEEEIYSLFRRYGTIIDIVPASDSVKNASVRYKSLKGAICAKNCVSGIEIHNTVLHIQYQQEARNFVISNFFVNHTRIAIPVMLAVLSIIAVLIFDPIREFSIEQKITHIYSLSWDNYWIRQIRNFTNSTVTSFRNYWGVNENAFAEKHLWEERIEKVNDLKMWLQENNNTFVVVRGPRGSGKNELIMQHTVGDRTNVLYLDCDKLIKSRTDAKFLRNAASQLGYFPIFPWINSVTSVIDLMVQGLTGQKSGLSETKEAQFRTMLTTALTSIRRIALKGYKSVIVDGGEDVNVKEEDYLQQHPEAKPIIVIDRYEGKSEINGFIYKELADWASMLVQMNVAHVIFLTETVSSNQQLSESLPNQVFKTLVLSDASKENSRKYVLSQLQSFVDSKQKSKEDIKITENIEAEKSKITDQIDDALEPLGGRMLDLQAFVRRVKSGEQPTEALDKMIEQASEQITQIFLSDKVDGIKSAQAWELIELLSAKSVVSYDDIVFKPLFKAAPELGIVELENSGLITVSRNRGVLDKIRPAKPLYKAAFYYLVNSQELSTILRTRYLLKVITFETGRIKKWEDELRPLGKSGDPKLFRGRFEYLSGKIETSNKVIVASEAEIKALSERKQNQK